MAWFDVKVRQLSQLPLANRFESTGFGCSQDDGQRSVLHQWTAGHHHDSASWDYDDSASWDYDDSASWDHDDSASWDHDDSASWDHNNSAPWDHDDHPAPAANHDYPATTAGFLPGCAGQPPVFRSHRVAGRLGNTPRAAIRRVTPPTARIIRLPAVRWRLSSSGLAATRTPAEATCSGMTMVQCSKGISTSWLLPE